MRPKVERGLGVAGVLAVALLIAAMPSGSASDHLDQPFPGLAANIDITDLYAFHPGGSTQDLSKVVFALNINPLTASGIHPTFSSTARYNVKVDTNGDAMPDIVYRFTFTPPDGSGMQTVTVTMLRGNNARIANGQGPTLAQGTTGTIIGGIGGSWVFTGLRDDPFFFDLAAFKGLHRFCDEFTGDFFAGFNVNSMVLQVNTDSLGDSPNIGVWTTIETPDDSGTYVQRDQMGRPAINTVLISTGNKAAFNSGQPKDQFATFGDDVIAHLKALDPLHDQARAEFLAHILLPDILTFDTSARSGFLNGRGLPDDVIDAELGLLTRGTLPGDCVDGNDVAFLDAFPYEAPPQ